MKNRPVVPERETVWCDKFGNIGLEPFNDDGKLVVTDDDDNW